MALKTGFSKPSLSFSVIRMKGPIGTEFEEALLEHSYRETPVTVGNDVIDFCQGLHLLTPEEKPEDFRYGGGVYFAVRKREKKVDSAAIRELITKMATEELMKTGEEPSTKRMKELKAEAEQVLEEGVPTKTTGIRVLAASGGKYIFVEGNAKKAEQVLGNLEMASGREDFMHLTPENLLISLIGEDDHSYESFSVCGHDSFQTVGQDFLTWMWMASESERVLDHDNLEIAIGDTILLSNPGEENGGSKDVKLVKGNPGECKEAEAAFLEGKKIREMRIMLSKRSGYSFEFTIDSTLSIKKFKILNEDKKGRSSEDVFADRLIALQEFMDVIISLFEHFVRIAEYNQHLIDQWVSKKWGWENPNHHVNEDGLVVQVEKKSPEQDNNIVTVDVYVYLEDEYLGVVRQVPYPADKKFERKAIAHLVNKRSAIISDLKKKYGTSTEVLYYLEPAKVGLDGLALIFNIVDKAKAQKIAAETDGLN